MPGTALPSLSAKDMSSLDACGKDVLLESSIVHLDVGDKVDVSEATEFAGGCTINEVGLCVSCSWLLCFDHHRQSGLAITVEVAYTVNDWW